MRLGCGPVFFLPDRARAVHKRVADCSAILYYLAFLMSVRHLMSKDPAPSRSSSPLKMGAVLATGVLAGCLVRRVKWPKLGLILAVGGGLWHLLGRKHPVRQPLLPLEPLALPEQSSMPSYWSPLPVFEEAPFVFNRPILPVERMHPFDLAEPVLAPAPDPAPVPLMPMPSIWGSLAMNPPMVEAAEPSQAVAPAPQSIQPEAPAEVAVPAPVASVFTLVEEPVRQESTPAPAPEFMALQPPAALFTPVAEPVLRQAEPPPIPDEIAAEPPAALFTPVVEPVLRQAEPPPIPDAMAADAPVAATAAPFTPVSEPVWQPVLPSPALASQVVAEFVPEPPAVLFAPLAETPPPMPEPMVLPELAARAPEPTLAQNAAWLLGLEPLPVIHPDPAWPSPASHLAQGAVLPYEIEIPVSAQDEESTVTDPELSMPTKSLLTKVFEARSRPLVDVMDRSDASTEPPQAVPAFAPVEEGASERIQQAQPVAIRPIQPIQPLPGSIPVMPTKPAVPAMPRAATWLDGELSRKPSVAVRPEPVATAAAPRPQRRVIPLAPATAGDVSPSKKAWLNWWK